MGYYKNEPSEKAYSIFAEKADQILVADIELAPHSDYNKDTVYKVRGVGSMFEGTYRFKRVIHTVNTSGYSVHAEARMVYDKRGAYVEGGYEDIPDPATPKKPPAPTTGKKDLIYTVIKGDTLWDIAKKKCTSALKWKDIEKANHTTLVSRDSRNRDSNGHWIYPGMKLKIPASILK